jgi:subtilase family serine protease
VIYASGAKPKSDCGWGQEAALDIEWAHAVAPKAKIILIEAKSNSFADLLQAVDVANNLQANSSPQITNMQVSMSWGGAEFSSEASFDSHFSNPSVAYLAASGDTGGKTIYPSTSPAVIAAGGTSLLFTSGHVTGEKGWSGSGGGTSPYESHLSYQDGITVLVGKRRSTPDLSFDADPATGVSVYDSANCGGLQGWMVFGGTSVASQQLQEQSVGVLPRRDVRQGRYVHCRRRLGLRDRRRQQQSARLAVGYVLGSRSMRARTIA